MADAQNPIPSPQSGDSDDVELALETSQRLYKNGDNVEALKWLRRAANSAEEAGDDMRQLQLARVAADLAAVVNAGPQVLTSAPSLKPSAAPAAASRLPQPPAKQPPPAPSARPGSTAPAKPSVMPAASGTPQPPSASTGGPPPLPQNKPRSAFPVAASPGRLAPESQPPPPQVSESQVPPAPKPATVSLKPKPAEPAASGIMNLGKPSATPTPSVAPIKTENKPSSSMPSGFIDISASRGAVRVSVRVSARDESLMIVRPLAQGQRVPPGAREARLVFDEASVALNQSHGE